MRWQTDFAFPRAALLALLKHSKPAGQRDFSPQNQKEQSVRSCCTATIQQQDLTSGNSSKPLHPQNDRKAQRKELRCLCVFLRGSSVPQLSLKSLFKKMSSSSLMQADRMKAAKTLLPCFLWVIWSLPLLYIQPHSPTPGSAFLLYVSLQQALDEGQFVWMFNAATQAAGGL